MKANFIDKVMNEFEFTSGKYPSFNTPHEGYAVILEELDELWDEIKKQTSNKKKMEREAIQVAAMAIRFLYDCCEE